MLDHVRRESALELKRHELAAQVLEGRTAIAALTARHAALADKIEEATAGLKKLEERLAAMDTVVRMFHEEDLFASADRARDPVLKVVSSQPAPAPAPRPLPATSAPSAPGKPARFRPLAYLQCISEGHTFISSRSMPGHLTCSHCRVRREA